MKTKVGILMGGYSSEVEISLKSGQMVYDQLDRSLFVPFKLCILKDKWYVDEGDKKYDIDRSDMSFTKDGAKITFDILFNAIHGTPGENGIIQGYLELLGLKQTSCDLMESALTFSKARCNDLLKQWEVRCAQSIFLIEGEEVRAEDAIDKLGLPMFVKPNRAGSSFGVSRVAQKEAFDAAIAEARKEDAEVLIESAVIGREFGCGVARLNGRVETLAVTEIVSKKAFFDYEAKYEGASDEITPAQINAELDKEIREITSFVYQRMGLKGVVRIDFIVEEKSGKPFVIEVNSVPGLSPESIVPQQVAHSPYDLKEFFTLLIQEALKN